MQRILRQTYQELLKAEHRPHFNFRKANRFALIYPGAYALGMSSLGLQVIYSLLNQRDDTACERAFLPEPEIVRQLATHRTTLFSFETQTHSINLICLDSRYRLNRTTSIFQQR